MITLKIALRNVFKNWRHSIASVISVSAAFLTLVLFQGYLKDVERLFETIYRHRVMFGDVLVEHRDLYSPAGRSEPWKYMLGLEPQKFLMDFSERHPELVAEQVRFLKISGLLSNGKTSIIVGGYGFDLAAGRRLRGERWGWNALYGNTLEDSGNPFGILIGQTMATLLGCTPDHKRKTSSLIVPAENEKIGFSCEGERTDLQITATTENGQLNAIDGEVVGLVDGGFKDIDSRYLNTSIEAAQTLLGTQSITYETFLLRSPDLAATFIELAQGEADAKNLPLKFQTWRQHPLYGEAFIRSMDVLAVFRDFVVVIVLTIATLSVLNSLVKLVKERTIEIGTLRSLGFRKFQIAQVFVFEAAGLAALGNFFGILIAILVSLAINRSGIGYKAGMFVESAPLTVAIDWTTYTYSFLYLTGLAMAAALIALRLTLGQKVSENLSYA